MLEEIRGALRVPDEPPPVFGTWGRLYAAIVIYLFALIGLFYIFTITFNGGR